MTLDSTTLKVGAGVVVTLGLYTVLYRENKIFRLFEHAFLGFAVGYTLFATWATALHETWWTKMLGSIPKAAHGGQPAQVGQPGFWAWAILLPIAACGYLVFSKKYNWMSRIPIGVIIGLWGGQQVQVWFTRYGPQINNSMKPLLPTTATWFKPDSAGLPADRAATINSTVYGSQALNNIIFVVTLLCVLSYFLYSFDVKNKVLKASTSFGRLALMVGFGAIFGSTVMMRFALLIDRMHLVFIDFLKHIVLNKP